MVLQEIEQGSTNESAFSTDYGSSSSSPGAGSTQVAVDVNQLPQPPPIFGALLGYTNKFLTQRVSNSIQSAAKALGRPLTQPEADAISYNVAGMSRTAAWGDVIGIGAGIYRWRATRAENRFPFRKTPMFVPERLGPIRGSQVASAMQVLRFLAFSSLGWAFGGLFFGSYGALTFSVKMAQDPRLEDFRDAVKRRGNARNGGLPERPVPAVPTQRRSTQDFSNDDMSPQSGSYTDTGLLSDSQMQARDRMQQPDPRSSPTSSTENTFSMDRVTRQPRGFDSYDDASPTAGSAPLESAWDRVRRQNVGGSGSGSGADSNAPRSFEQRSQARGAMSQQDSFSFSSTEEERQLAKSEAQRDFDARIERERRGGDFAEDRGGRFGR